MMASGATPARYWTYQHVLGDNRPPGKTAGYQINKKARTCFHDRASLLLLADSPRDVKTRLRSTATAASDFAALPDRFHITQDVAQRFLDVARAHFTLWAWPPSRS